MAQKPKTRVGTNRLSEGRGMAGLKLNQPPCTVLPKSLSQLLMQCRRLAPSSLALGWKTVFERVRFFYFYVNFILIDLFNKMEKISIFKKHICTHRKKLAQLWFLIKMKLQLALNWWQSSARWDLNSAYGISSAPACFSGFSRVILALRNYQILFSAT